MSLILFPREVCALGLSCVFPSLFSVRGLANEAIRGFVVLCVDWMVSYG